MPKGEPIRLGPFVGGINITSDPTAIADAEMADCNNFSLEIDGTLSSRGPFQELTGADWSERAVAIGTAIFSDVYYAILSNTDGVWAWNDGTYTLITDTFQSYVSVQYANSLYILPEPGAGIDGGKWDPTNGFTAVSALPEAQAAIQHKERLFTTPGINSNTNPTRLKFSAVGDFEDFPSANFIDIGQGDGTNLVTLTSYKDNLLLFKENTTYVLAYDTSPSEARLRQISSSIGVDRQYNIVNYENQVYLFHNGWVYEVVNYDFNRINTKVPFVEDQTTPGTFTDENIFLTLMSDWLIARFYNKIYVYGLRTRTWTEWSSNTNSLHYFGPIVTLREFGNYRYIAGTCVSELDNLVELIDEPTVSTSEEAQTVEPHIVDTFSRTVSSGWGTCDTGETWNTGDTDDYSVDGSQGVWEAEFAGATSDLSLEESQMVDVDVKADISVQEIQSDDDCIVTLKVRQDALDNASNAYWSDLSFNSDGTLYVLIRKVVNGSLSTINTTSITSYSADTFYSLRFSVIGNNLRSKVWLSSDNEPSFWDIDITDSDITESGYVAMRHSIGSSSSLTFPTQAYVDNFEVADTDTRIKTIDCFMQTKNFDMAQSHQFKRLWWWGADVVSNNLIKGTATPIITTFKSTWDDLASFQWDSLNTWDNLLGSPVDVSTEIPNDTQVKRRFVKFKKGLRFRQINFSIDLKTDGSTSDGPAKVFTMTIIMGSRQVVPKQVS